MSPIVNWLSQEFYNKRISISTNLIGEYNLYNIMAAIAVAIKMNIPINKISQALSCPIIIPGRMECVYTDSPGKIFIDYAHSPDAYEKLFKTSFNYCYFFIK